MAGSRITVLEGFGFGRHHRRRKHRKHYKGYGSAGAKRQRSKMKHCAVKWKRHGHGSYRSFMKKCLKK